jgi:class 3 adenylate cyclase
MDTPTVRSFEIRLNRCSKTKPIEVGVSYLGVAQNSVVPPTTEHKHSVPEFSGGPYGNELSAREKNQPRDDFFASPPAFVKTIGVMGPTEEREAWLDGDGQQHILHGNCSLGRGALNSLVLESPKVSRLHAIIHLESAGAFWLIDLGSSNGTFLNRRRIHEPVRLHDHDQIMIGGNVFVFRQPRKDSGEHIIGGPALTLQEMENLPCWVLVADIKNFTRLSRRIASEKLATLVSSWLALCKEIIDRHQGAINKYLGDGILAYWRDNDDAAENIVAVIGALKKAQTRPGPRFRFIVHYGLVAIGGVASMREESLMGSEVNLAFRLEKLAASLGEACGISDAAHAKLRELVPARLLGNYELKGFEGERAFFAV